MPNKLGKHYLLGVAPLPLEEALAFYQERAQSCPTMTVLEFSVKS